jgi:type I site-specific restriction endonuclease
MRRMLTPEKTVRSKMEAFLIGLTATPGKQAMGFFNKNLVSEYPHERAVADGINAGFESTLWLSADKLHNNASFIALLRSA